MALSNQISNYLPFKYIVTGSQPGTFHTIQSAIDYVEAEGVTTTIFVRPGLYIENLVFTSGNVNIQGAEEGQVLIVGTHTPPAIGSLVFRNCVMQSATNILSSAAAGKCNVTFDNCTFNITGAGYVANLVNWERAINIDNCLEQSAGVNNIVLNASSANIQLINSNIGSIGGAGLVAGAGNLYIRNCRVYCSITTTCPLNIIESGSYIEGTITATDGAGASSLRIFNSHINGKLNAALDTDMTGDVILSNVALSSSNNPVIDGSSTISASDLSFPSTSNTVAGTITILDAPTSRAGQVIAQNLLQVTDGNIELLNGRLNVNTTIGTDGQLIIGNTAGLEQWASLTSTGGTVAITAGPSTLNLEVAEGGINWGDQAANVTMDVGHGYINTKPAAILNLTLPAVAAQGSTIEIAGSAANLWAIAQQAGQTIYFGNQQTTPGVGGSITSTHARDTLRMFCIVANTTWQVLSSTGVFIVV